MLAAVQPFRRQLAESTAALRSVFRNANLRRIVLAAMGSGIGSWAYAIAISVYAFDQGGAGAVGLVWIIRTIPSAFASPVMGVLADRYRRDRVMIASDAIRALLMAVAALLIWTDSAPIVVYLMAGLISLVGMAFEPAQAAIMPSLATTPVELTAANVTTATIESASFFLGPALGGVLLAVTSIEVVFVVTAGTLLWSAFFVSRIRVEPEEAPAPPQEELEAKGLVAEALAGFTTLFEDRRLRLLVGLLAAVTVVVGAIEVLVVSLALDLLDLGQSGVGYLNSAFGVGALVGAAVAAGFVGIRRLSVPFIVGAVLWGVPMILIGAWSSTVVAVVCLGLLGAANTLVDVSGFTLVQRAVPEDVLARVFSVMQMLWMATIGIGAAIAPGLISGVGVAWAFAITGIVMLGLVVVFGPQLVRIDSAATAPAANLLELLQRLDIFAPLPGAVIERLATRLIPLNFERDAVIIREGESGDRFYIVESGEVTVSSGGAAVATLGPGTYVGEIALLRDVPRTATVIAATAVGAYALERDDFLTAVGSNPGSREALETTVASRLSGLRATTGRIAVPRF